MSGTSTPKVGYNYVKVMLFYKKMFNVHSDFKSWESVHSR